MTPRISSLGEVVGTIKPVDDPGGCPPVGVCLVEIVGQLPPSEAASDRTSNIIRVATTSSRASPWTILDAELSIALPARDVHQPATSVPSAIAPLPLLLA